MARLMDMFAGHSEPDPRTEALPDAAEHLLQPLAARPDVPVHEAANLFPMLDEKSLGELADAIAANGQIEPIVMIKGKILDGRNRWVACRRKGIKPLTKEWSGEGGSPTQYVIDQNLRRRHLTDSQRAAVALDMVPLFEQEAQQRKIAAGVHGDKGGRGRTLGAESTPRVSAKKEAGKSVVQAAKAVGASPGAVKKLKQAARTAPEVVELAKQSKVTVGEAAQIAQLPETKKKEAVARIQAGEKAKAVLPPKAVKGPAQAPALRVDCPTCGAKAGEGCRTPMLQEPRQDLHRDRQQVEAALPDTACLQHECPDCKQPAGQFCVRPSGGKAASLHNARQDLAEATALGKPYRFWRDALDEEEEETHPPLHPAAAQKAVQKVQAALDKIQRAQTLLEQAAEELSPVVGMQGEHEQVLALYDQVKAGWYKLNGALLKRLGRIHLDSEPA